MRARCQNCGFTGNPDPVFIWYRKTFTWTSRAGKELERTLWLCPECAGFSFRSDKARDAFLKSMAPESAREKK
jgi:predicted RNA-binding Zn-ribbon protein involved in translation (DUF1610 family)